MPMIAIVDDDESIREALDGLLASFGYRTQLFRSAEQFLAWQAHSTPDCVISDVRMPGLSGIELQRRLRAEGFRRPIIFMTSYVDDLTRTAALDGGAAGFLSKPVDDEALIACLQAGLNGSARKGA